MKGQKWDQQCFLKKIKNTKMLQCLRTQRNRCSSFKSFNEELMKQDIFMTSKDEFYKIIKLSGKQTHAEKLFSSISKILTFLKVFIPATDLDEVFGDLQEAYYQISEKNGSKYAKIWLCCKIVVVGFHYSFFKILYLIKTILA
jgi:sulfite reductase alpha subunit-like flavoprotein